MADKVLPELSSTSPLLEIPEPHRYRLLLAASAQGEGVEAVADFGELVFGLRPAAHHRAWIEERLTNKRVATVAPPDSAKTTWTEILDAWWIGKHPDTSNGVVSATDAGAMKMGAVISGCIEGNPGWAMAFPHVVPDKERGWSRFGWWVKDTRYAPGEWAQLTAGQKDPTLIAGGVGAAVWAGVRITGRMSLDDIHDRESKTSQTVCDDTVGFFKDTALSRVTSEAFLDIEQTRWNRKDVIAYVMGLPHFKVFQHPAWTVNEAGEKVSYWPDQRPIELLEAKMMETGTPDFRLQYLGDTTALLGTVLKADWLVDFPQAEIKRTWPCVWGVDPAFKKVDLVRKSGKRSRFAIACWRIAPFGLVLDNIYADFWTEFEAEEEMQRQSASDRPKRIGIETNGVGDPFYQSLLRRTRLPLIPMTATQDTIARASAMAPDFEFGRVRVSDAMTPGLRLFRDEWITLGEAGSSDDTISAAYWGWRTAQHALWKEDAFAEKKSMFPTSPMRAIEAAYHAV